MLQTAGQTGDGTDLKGLRPAPTNPTNDQAPGYAAEPPLVSAAALAILSPQLVTGTPDTDSCSASSLP